VVEPAEITVTIVNDDTPGVVTCQSLGAIKGNSGLNNAAIACSSPSRITGTIDYCSSGADNARKRSSQRTARRFGRRRNRRNEAPSWSTSTERA
jgi:hypothetical protein